MKSRRVLLGELLVESKVITAEQLAEVLASQREGGKKLGQVLLERGYITEAQLTQTLSLQLSVPWVSLYHIDFSRQLLNRLSREICERYCLIPIFVRHVKGQGETLYVAMDDPTNEAALAEVARLAGLPTKPMIASASDIRSAIRLYYGDPNEVAPVIEVPVPPTRLDPPTTTREGRGRDVAPPTPPAPTVPEAPRSNPSNPPPPPPPPKPRAAEEPSPATTRSYPPQAIAAATQAQASAVKEKERRSAGATDTARRKPGGARMFNLTLLDGTTIALPPKGAKKEETPAADGLTTADLVSALRAAAEGKDASKTTGEPVKWEPIVAALLEILVRKGLIADWELIDEIKKR